MLQPSSEYQNGHSRGSATNGNDADLTQLPTGGLNLKRHVEQVELALIRQALERSRGVVASAARLLCLRRTTLVEKLRKYRNQNHQIDTTA